MSKFLYLYNQHILEKQEACQEDLAEENRCLREENAKLQAELARVQRDLNATKQQEALMAALFQGATPTVEGRAAHARVFNTLQARRNK